jgi:hypothetical protein
VTVLIGEIPPLIKLIRPGPGRQRLAKGYLVDDSAKRNALESVLAPGSRAQAKASELGFLLRGSSQLPNALWIDSGLVWLHSHDQRERLAIGLKRMVEELATELAAFGAALLPSAVRLDAKTPWNLRVCGDEHFIETASEREKTLFCNLVRYHSPELIALTGRAGASPTGVEQLGSRRLADSQRHLAARAFMSLAPEYLPHLMKSLVRDERVPHTSLLDIDPHASDGKSSSPGADACVELRFVDAQITIRNALAHAMLFQALLIRARRLATEDKLVPRYSQRHLERDRARAIQHGLQARFMPRLSPTETDPSTSRAELVPASLRVLELLDDLNYEFQALEVAPRQIRPILLGIKLRQWGHLSVQNENDLLQSVLARKTAEPLERRIQALVLSGEDALSQINERAFAEQTRDINKDWKQRLWVEPRPIDQILAEKEGTPR